MSVIIKRLRKEVKESAHTMSQIAIATQYEKKRLIFSDIKELEWSVAGRGGSASI